MVPADSRGITRVPRYSGIPAAPGELARKRLSRPMAALSSAFRFARRKLSPGDPTTPPAPRRRRFGLLPFRSPLLGESFLFSPPAGTEMFQFPAFASRMSGMPALCRRVAPFGNPRVKGPLAPTRGFSQLAAPFVACGSLGIHHAPFRTSSTPLPASCGEGPSFICFPFLFQHVNELSSPNRGRWRITDSNR